VGAATQLAFTVQPANGSVNTAIVPAIQVTVRDASGNTVTSATNAITIALGTNPGAASLGGTVTVNAVAGVAPFSTLNLSAVGTGYTLTATATGLTSATSNTFNVVAAGAAVKLAFTTQPTNALAGSSISPAVMVTVQDGSGNTVTTSNAMITVALGTNPGTSALSGTVTATAVNGVATFTNLSLNRPGLGYTLTATSTGLTSASSATFDLATGAANRLAFVVQPSNSPQNVPIAPTVQVRIEDALGNLVTTATNTVSMGFGTNPTSGNLTGSTSLSAVAGVATFSDLALDRTGTGYTLAATSIGLTGATSNTFNVTLAAGARLVFTVQPPATTLLGNALTPAVRVEVMDLDGFTTLPVSDNVTLALGNAGGSALQGTSAQAAINGIVTFNDLRVDRLGSGYTLIATATGITGATSNPFSLVRLATRVVFLVQPSTTNAGSTFSPTIQVALQDANGATVTGDTDAITLAFGTNSSGASLGGTRTANAINGIATFNDLKVSRGGKGYTLAATATALTSATSNTFDVRFVVAFNQGFSMVTLPLIPDVLDPQALVGFTGNFWARWNPSSATSGAYARYPDSFSFFDTTPGKGYWLRLDAARTVTPLGTFLNPASPLVIPLKAGWNQIGNPFSVQLVWDVNAIKVRQTTTEQSLRTAEAAGLVDPFVWGFEPNATNPLTGAYFPVYDSAVVAGVRGALDSGRGYWIRANQACDLVLPVPTNLLANRVRSQTRTSNGDWLVTLSAESGGARDAVMFGVSESERSVGKLQIAKPPASPGGNEVEIAILAEGRNDALGIERRQSLAELSRNWHFVVRSQRPQAEVTLNWPNLGTAPRSYRFILVDEATGARRYMRTTTGYSLRTGAAGEERRFRIEVDPSPDPSRLLSQLTVTPSGPGLHFAVVLSKDARLNLRVLSPAGKVIATPASNVTGRSGLNSVTWNARTATGASPARGLYLLELTATTDEGEEVRMVKALPLK